MAITNDQRFQLCLMMHCAFVEIRSRALGPQHAQAASLASALHNVPVDMWGPDFSLEFLRDCDLKPYQKMYPEPPMVMDYVATVEDIIKSGEPVAAEPVEETTPETKEKRRAYAAKNLVLDEKALRRIEFTLKELEEKGSTFSPEERVRIEGALKQYEYFADCDRRIAEAIEWVSTHP